MTGLTKQSHILARVVIQNYADVMLPLIVLFDRFDGGNLSGERDVHHIAARARTQAHAASRRHLDSRNFQTIERRLLLEELPFPFVHWVSSLSGRKPRRAPCNFMNCSTGMVSVRSSIWRARSSDWLISRLSSSARVMMRNDRISSISVPSNRSPALSGAIWG